MKAINKIKATIEGPGYSLKILDMSVEDFVAAVRKFSDGQVVDFDVDTEFVDDWGF